MEAEQHLQEKREYRRVLSTTGEVISCTLHLLGFLFCLHMAYPLHLIWDKEISCVSKEYRCILLAGVSHRN